MAHKTILHQSNKPLPTTHIHAMAHDGRGIGKVANKTTFVSGALPDETVSLQLTRKHSHYNEAIAVDILTPSPDRTSPPCQHANICGGCSQQHMSNHLQMQLKQQTLLEQFQHFGKVTPVTMLAPLHAETLGYRRKARLGVRFVHKKDKLLIGFREKAGRYLADIDTCVVLHPKVGNLLPALRVLIMGLSQYQQIPQIEVAIGDEECALVFRHLTDLTEEDRAQLSEFAKNHQLHLYLQPNSPAPLTKLWPEDQHERLTYTLPEFNLTYHFHPLDFTQINHAMNRLMVNQALTLLDIKPHETALDLFCGMGNFTLPLARYAKSVTGVEGNAEMVSRARDNASLNGLTQVQFVTANLMDPPPDAPWINTAYDKIILDPPRAGAKEILPWFKSFSAQKIVYISCNPATLARDAGELVHQHGYTLTRAGIMDMFPHTSHIEAMAVFEKN